MRILWITNILFPEAIAKITGCDHSQRESGGWMNSAAEQLLASGEHTLVVASVTTLVGTLTRVECPDIVYYALPCRSEQAYHSEFEGMWKEIVAAEKPELVHIHGTEFAHGLAFMRVNPGIPTLLSMQGVMAAIGQHYLDGLTRKDIVRHTSLFDLCYSRTLLAQQRHYETYGSTIEREMISRADAIVGRTTFDKDYVLSVKPEARYFMCNETLRPAFYDGRWTYEGCRKHSIFLSQANYPVKGFHQLLKALPELLKRCPDVEVRVAGQDMIHHTSLKSKLIKNTYSKLLGSWIKRDGLRSCVHFLGPLTAEQMKEELLSANLFLCPSTVENSPNSLGEAQLLGVPCLAARVGGVPDFCQEEACGTVYPFDDITALMQHILHIFDTSDAFDNTRMQQVAHSRHNQQENARQLSQIYNALS